MSKTNVIRYHDFCYGHRVFGHENKCSRSHGHNGRVHFKCEAENGQLDSIGRVIDFSEIKFKLCNWIESNWDHRFLLWEDDPWVEHFKKFDSTGLIIVPFNPTAENMAQYLVEVIGPQQLNDTGIILTSVTIEETRKCSVSYGN